MDHYYLINKRKINWQLGLNVTQKWEISKLNKSGVSGCYSFKRVKNDDATPKYNVRRESRWISSQESRKYILFTKI